MKHQSLRRSIVLLNLIVIFFADTAYSQVSDTSKVAYRKPLFDFEPSKPTFEFVKEQKENSHRMLRYSLFTGYREGVDPIQGQFGVNFAVTDNKLNGTRRIYMYNLSVEEMFTKGLDRSSKVFFEVAHPEQYRYDSGQGSKLEWMRKYGHCFELVLPIGRTDKNEIIRAELSRILNLSWSYEKRLMNILILVRTSNRDKIKSKSQGEPRYDQQGYFNNITLDRIGDLLYKSDFPPFIDETNYKGPVDLDLRLSSVKNLNNFREALKKYDLDLREEKREIQMLVIKEL